MLTIAMSDARYRPCDFLVQGVFGASATPQWKARHPSDPVMRRQHEASRIQHRWARAIRDKLDVNHLDEVDFAEAAGCSVDRVQRMLRGQVVMRLEDMAVAKLLLGVGGG